VGLDKTLRAGN